MTDDSVETVVVTVGAGGIGSATVRVYVSHGKRVVIGEKDYDGAMRLAREIGENVHCFPLDILDYDSIRSFAESVGDSYGAVSHLVSVAGGAMSEETVDSGIEDISIEGISTAIDWNLKSHLYLLKEFLPLMKADTARDRSVVLISSISALFSFGQPAYSSAKAGMLGIVRSTANELGKYNIRINAVLPGSTRTPQGERFLGEVFHLLRKASSLKRLTTSDEVANAIYALTHLMTSVTGQYIAVDSGQSVAYPYRGDG